VALEEFSPLATGEVMTVGQPLQMLQLVHSYLTDSVEFACGKGSDSSRCLNTRRIYMALFMHKF